MEYQGIFEQKEKVNKITWGNPVVMTFDTFKTCIDKLSKDVEIHFSGFAEPWLNPECTKMLLYAHDKGHNISVYSTLDGMTLEDVDLFKHIPFNIFEIHLPDIEKYAKIAVNKQYVELLKKIISSDIHNITFMSMGKLPEDIKQIIGMDFPPNMMIDRAGNCELGEKSSKKFGPLFCSIAHKNGINLLDSNVLLPNGDVCLCCMDYGVDHVLGNLESSDYDSLFTGEVFQTIKQKLNAEDSNIMCRVCPFSLKVNEANIKRADYIAIEDKDDKISKNLKKLYNDLLLRDIDTMSLEYFKSMLENNNLSIEDVKEQIMESEEYKGIHRLRNQLTL